MSDSPPRRGRRPDAAKREAILDAGWALFLECGVGATAVEAVAARAGVSKMTVYKHFTDKGALFEAAVRREMAGIEAAQAPGMAEGPLADRLRAFGMGIMAFLGSPTAIDYYNVLVGELRRHPELAEAFEAAGPRRTLALLAALLEEARGELTIGDADEAAEALFGLWQGASNFLPAGRGDDVAARVARGVAVFLRAYGRAPADGSSSPRT